MAVLPTGIGPVTGYNIERSLRFNSADSAYLNRTPASAGNRQIFTWSGWVKRSASGNVALFTARTDDSNRSSILFESENLRCFNFSGGSVTSNLVTSAVFRDFSAWYHVVISMNTTTQVGKIYVNGVEQTLGTNTVGLNSNFFFNNTNAHAIGRTEYSTPEGYFNGYLTEVNFIDGQALTPSSFGETDSATGVWKPKAFSGTYGTNGFYLKFADNSGTTSTTLGKDSSGNGNNWTPNNFSVTAGSGNDSLVDSPTSYGTDTGVGGEVRGNYATLNPLRNHSSNTLSNGNLDIISTDAASSRTTFATIGVTSGKWYWEHTVTATDSGSTYYPGFGVNTDLSLLPSGQSGDTASGYMYLKNGQKYNSGSLTAYGASYTTNDVIGVALDMDAGTITFYKNGSSQGQAFSGITGTAVSCVVGAKGTNNVASLVNFGQRAFAYTAPSGFKALCTQNLPTPAVVQGDDYFNTVTFTGDSTSNRTITTGLQSDFVWTKRRNDAYGHLLFDAIRGAGRTLRSQDSAAESNDGGYYVQQFNSTNFLIGATDNALNHSSGTYVAWVWNAGGSNATNTAGSITSTVRANTTSGFSIVTYTGTGANATVGHGLGVAPSMIIAKRRNGIADWMVAHSGVNGGTNPFNYYMLLNTTAAQTADSTAWNNTAPTSTVFSLGSGGNVNSNGATNVAYCFAPVAGYSAFGSYTGNGTTTGDGPFVYLGFRPAFVSIKCSSATDSWHQYDKSRIGYNSSNSILYPNLSDAEISSTNHLDFLANGFKLRSDNVNQSGRTFIYMAFAESPFKYSLAR